jgi:hypothetical protein
MVNIAQDHLEKILLYDVSGQLIQSFESSSQISVGHLPKGVYLLKLYSKTDVSVDKLVIQ